MFAIVRSGGKQLRVQEGDNVRVEKLPGEVGDKVVINEVLLVGGAEGVRIGRPLVEGAQVTARIVRHAKHRKVLVFKYKKRVNYRRKRGHRQHYTALEIESIAPGGN